MVLLTVPRRGLRVRSEPVPVSYHDGDDEEGRLLEEYASRWALILTTPDSVASAQARVAEIDESNPEVVDAYVRVVLPASRAWDLGCGTPGSS